MSLHCYGILFLSSDGEKQSEHPPPEWLTVSLIRSGYVRQQRLNYVAKTRRRLELIFILAWLMQLLRVTHALETVDAEWYSPSPTLAAQV